MIKQIWITWISGHVTHENNVSPLRVRELRKSKSIVEIELIAEYGTSTTIKGSAF